MLVAALIACHDAPDPQADAWVGAVKLTSVAESTDGCTDAAPVDPQQPFVYVAIDRGVPDLATVYWCHATDDCDQPVASVAIEHLTRDHLEGSAFTTESAGGSLCQVDWSVLTADQSGKDVTITLQTGLVEQGGVAPADCDALGSDVLGQDCGALLELEGNRVEE